MKIWQLVQMGQRFLARVEQAKSDRRITWREALDIAHGTLVEGLETYGLADRTLWEQGSD